jgi:inhibitor of KinA
MVDVEYQPVGDQGVLVVFGDVIDDFTISSVQALDAALAADPPIGMTEAVPTFTTLLVCFDPLITDHPSLTAAIENTLNSVAAAISSDLDSGSKAGSKAGRTHTIDVCYEADCAPDMHAVCARMDLSPASVIAAHSDASYTVGMYGFAPGYAYLHGTPSPLQIPRNPTPGPPRPAGSVIIAGQQCLIIPSVLSTGWYAIGRTASAVMTDDDNHPFRFDVGDTIRFNVIDHDEFHRQSTDLINKRAYHINNDR